MSYRVLIVAHGHPELSPGGAEIASYLLFRGLQRRDGVEAYYLARTGDAARRRDDTPFSALRGRPDEILIFTDETDPFLFSQRSSELIDRFAALVARLAPNVVHFHHYTQLGLELIAVVRRVDPQIRIVVTLHEYLAICHHYGQMVKTGTMALCMGASPHDCAECFTSIAPAEFLRRELFVRAHFEKVDVFVAPSEFLRQRYIAWGIPAWQIAVLDNASPATRPPPPRPLAASERRSMFGFFGQINPYKGLLQLLSAFTLLERFPPAATRGLRLVVHGANLELNHPQFVEAIKQLLARTAQRVHFAGAYHSRDQYCLMAAIDWVVVPSVWWENSPLVIEEALAHRRPVICSNIGGMAEKVRSGKDGYHFAVGNPFELASLLIRLAADEGAWERLRSTMRLPTPVDAAVSQHLRLYRDGLFAVAS
jgi:glycosyltransferase involved in cell wall biosynthesis